MAKLVFLGRLEDIAGGPEREVSGGDLAQVLAQLEPPLTAALNADRIHIALNGNLITDHSSIVLGDSDELAFLPPVSGG